MRDALADTKTANGRPVLETDGDDRRVVAHGLAVLDEAALSPKPRLAHPVQSESSGAEREAKTERSPNVRWQGSRLTRARRWRSLGQAGATVWFTGLPGAGKSTVATAVEECLVVAGRPAFLLDGDNLRHGLNGDLGFDELARAENVRRTAHVARLLAESGMIALVSLISPYIADRQTAAALHAAEDLRFLEVFVSTPLQACEERDPKGLYARARAGELKDLTGVGAPYEAPTQPDLVLHTCSESVQDEVESVLELLAAPHSR